MAVPEETSREQLIALRARRDAQIKAQDSQITALLGETAADFLNKNLGLGLTATSVIMAILLGAVLMFQFRSRRYVPGIYWLAVVLISVVGTLISDNLVDNFGVARHHHRVRSRSGWTFVGWYVSEKSLSVHTICTTRREGFAG